MIGGARAVGLANKKNPLPLIIPCHRVIGSNGKSCGFTPNPSLQTKLLAMEATFKELCE